MKIVSIPNLSFNFLIIAKKYAIEINSKNKLNQAIKIIIFSVTAAEAFANYEGFEYLNNAKLKKFTQNGFKPKNSQKSKIYYKWNFILNKVIKNKNKINELLDPLEDAINIRNKLIHFKPYKNKTEKILVKKKKKVLGPNGDLFTAYRISGYSIKKAGIINELTLGKARYYFKVIDVLIFEYMKAKKIWPDPKFTNDYYGNKSPFWKHRKNF